MSGNNGLRKVTVNLSEASCKFFEKRFGYGWSTELRRIMDREVQNYKKRDEGIKDFNQERFG